MSKISFDYENAINFVTEKELGDMEQIVEQKKEELVSGKGKGNDYIGWIDLPVNYDKEEFVRIEKAAEKIKGDSDYLIVIGIGGSYLGARAAIEFLMPKSNTKVLYAGNNISTSYLLSVMEEIKGKDFSINVISKSGTTTEPAIAFRIFKKLLEEKYGKSEAANRIYATTDKEKGALKTLANNELYETFVVPDDVGGRFSVLTAVGLLPIAVAGADIRKLMEGAKVCRERCLNKPYNENDALKYAAIRNVLLEKNKTIEVLANYEPSLHYVAEWWKQLYGESEGKDGKGIFPASLDLTADLHSMGQYMQDGIRCIFETVLNIEECEGKLYIENEESDLDGLNYLAGKTLDYVNKSAMKGTILAHIEGDVPNLLINIPKQNEYYLGELFYFFEFACGVSGYVLGVNPFNQPGVESYKKNMFEILGKPTLQ